jgi:hypothetical protein
VGLSPPVTGVQLTPGAARLPKHRERRAIGAEDGTGDLARVVDCLRMAALAEVGKELGCPATAGGVPSNRAPESVTRAVGTHGDRY